jgi:hypothetical protein
MNREFMNIAGMMGQRSSQPARMTRAATVDPLERLNQRMSGRTQGGNVKKKTQEDRMRRSLMSSYGAM